MNIRPSRQTQPAEPARLAAYTPRQGQYLAFIHYYTKLNGLPPAKGDMERYSGTSPSPCIRWSFPWKSTVLSSASPAGGGRSACS